MFKEHLPSLIDKLRKGLYDAIPPGVKGQITKAYKKESALFHSVEKKVI